MCAEAQPSTRKPKLSKEPRAWLSRKVRLKLNDAIRRFGWRVAEQVGFAALRPARAYRHILDVGVADGTPDLYARFPSARIEMFEPSPERHDGLRRSVVGRYDAVLHEVALGSRSGTVPLHVTGRTGSTLLGSTRKDPVDVPVVNVPIARLDDIISAQSLQRPCLLKIDTEGYELEVLKGAEKLLPAIDMVVVEVHFGKLHAYHPQQIIGLLNAAGFSLTDMLDHHVLDRRVVCADLVFERLG